MKNEMTLAFDSISENEGFARVAVAAFVTQLDPTLEEVADIKTAVSEAVTNAIIHGYPTGVHTVVIRAKLTDRKVELWITDEGVGIPDVARAMEPLYTSRPDLERSGMGFMFMEAFMDQVQVESTPGLGTTVYMSKQVGNRL
jgi:stage II sporulation protein AB (anti-sigma F factor)